MSFLFWNRRRRVVICASLRPHRGSGAVLPCAQSLLSATGKCKPFRRSAFLTKLSAPSLIFPRGVLFSHIFCKRKNSHICVSFFFWKPASTYSPGHVSASYIALFFAAPQNVRRVARPSRDVFLLRRENLSAPVLCVLIKLSARSLIFPPQIFAWLSTAIYFHRIQNKKLTQTCEPFVLETGVDILSRAVSASYIALFFTAPQNVRRVARPSRDVFLLRRENLFAPVLRVLRKLSARSLIFPPQIVYLAVHGKSLPSCTKQKHPTDVECFCFGNRRRHTLPGRVQPSTICADELNFCVRYENRWDLIAIDTGNC